MASESTSISPGATFRAALIAVLVIGLGLVAGLTWLTSTDKELGSPLMEAANGQTPPGESQQFELDLSTANEPTNELSAELGDQTTAAPLGTQLDLILAGRAPIAEFIAENIDAAQRGDAHSAFYVSMALKECAVAIQQMSLALALEVPSNRSPGGLGANDLVELEESLVANLPPMHEFARNEVLNRIQRAKDCFSLGTVDELYGSARELSLISIQDDYPLAYITSTSVDWSSVEADELNNLQVRTRHMFEKSKDHQVFFFAAEVAAASLEIDPKLEKLSWAIAACDFNDCDVLSRLYRGSCERMTLKGQGDFCSKGLTDSEYLVLKYPGAYDKARSRAIEITSAILSENWEQLGL